MTGPRESARFDVFDRMRGLIMVVMAIDHAAFFIARRHPAETWADPPPWYDSGVAFATRWITHLCAPGFFLLMGASLVWFAVARQASGWTASQVPRTIVTRGVVLLIIQHFVENPAWLMGLLSAGPGAPKRAMMPGDDSNVIAAFAVITALGASMIVWSSFVNARAWIVATISIAALALGVAMTPAPADATRAFPILVHLLFVPGQSSVVEVAYPIVPWLVPAGLGLLVGRLVLRDPAAAPRRLGLAGVALLAIFVALRLAGVGDPHPPSDGAIGWLSVTKYPPSPAFLAIMIGLDLVVIATLSVNRVVPITGWLAVYGRVPLFFYLLHLYLLGAVCWFFPSGTSFGVMYLVWAGVIATAYPLCARYGRFKAQRPITSIWRTF